MPLLVLLAICLLGRPAEAQYGGGTGEPNDPYLIYTAEQMNEIGLQEDDWDKHFKLMGDIDLSTYTGTQFNKVGLSYRLPFSGVFDGNGKKISNFFYTPPDANNIGLFGYVISGAVIKDLGLIAPNIDAGTRDSVGSLVGSNRGTITNCYAEGGSVSGDENVGGLVGKNVGAISNCYVTGEISGNDRVGGLVGNNYGTITNCYSIGRVSGISHVGGLIGTSSAGVAVSFWDIQTSGKSTSAGGTGKTTAEMQRTSTFLGWGGCGNEAIWTIDEGNDYPRLWWENKAGEVIQTQQLSAFLTGAGTENDPYLIYTAEELNVIGVFPCELDKHFKLMSDIDLADYTGTDFNIIGIDWQNPFTGVFDGSGHTISNFTYTSTNRNQVGFFGFVRGKDAEIRDLGLLDPNITGRYSVGSLVGYLRYGTISNCYVEAGSVWGSGTSWWYRGVGGLVGYNGGTITNCYSSASVSAEWYVGGLVGHNSFSGTITYCYATGSVAGDDDVGGLVGVNEDTITNCYSTGSVTGTTHVGGLIGSKSEYGTPTVTDSFWDIQTSGQSISAGGTGKTTAEMQTESTFTDAGWDFLAETENGTEDIWWILEGQDYPRLWWELVGN